MSSSNHSPLASHESKHTERYISKSLQALQYELGNIVGDLDKTCDISLKNSILALLVAFRKLSDHTVIDNSLHDFQVALKDSTEASKRSQSFEMKLLSYKIRIVSILHIYHYFDVTSRNEYQICEACRGPWNDLINLPEVRAAIRDEFESTGIFSFRKIGKSRSVRHSVLCAVSDIKQSLESILGQNLTIRDSNGEIIEFMGHNTNVFNGHSSNISVFSVNASEGFLYSGSLDSVIKVWDIIHCEDISTSNLCTLCGPTGGIYSIAYHEDRVFGGSGDNQIWVWNKISRKTMSLVSSCSSLSSRCFCIGTLKGHSGIIYSLVFHNGLLFSGGGDNDIFIWDFRFFSTGKDLPTSPLTICSGHCNSVCAMVASNTRLYSGSWDSDIKVWEITKFDRSKLLSDMGGSTKSVSSVATYTSTGTTTSFGSTISFDGTFPLCSVDTDSGRIYSMAISTSKNRLYSGSWNNEIMVWDISNHNHSNDHDCSILLLSRINAHGGSVYSLVIHGNRLFSGGGDNKVKIWDIYEYNDEENNHSHNQNTDFDCHLIPRANLKGRSGTIYALAVVDEFLFSASSSEIHVWEHGQLKGKVFESPSKSYPL